MPKRSRLAGVFHALGKIGLPDRVLLKPGSLTDDERQQMEHKRPDGTGYPLGLSGSDVSLEARIIAVADSYEAMTSDHPYRAALPNQAARDELSRHRETQFDGIVVDALIRVLDVADDMSPTSRRGPGICLTDMPAPAHA